MAYKPTRRRGPNKPKTVTVAGPDGDMVQVPASVAPVVQEAAPATSTVAHAPTRRRKRADVNGMHLKLAAPEREGYHRRWVIDKPGRLAMFQKLAYDFVRDESIESDGTDSRIRRTTGTMEGGAPQYSYYMETPLEEYQHGVDEKEESRAAFEAAINRGDDPLGSSLTTKTESHSSSIS
jgi:hypothetical protein